MNTTSYTGDRARAFALQTGLTLLSLLFIAPLIWLALTTLLPKSAILSANPFAAWREASFDNFVRIFRDTPFAGTIWNSIVVSVVVTVIGVYIGTLGGYAFAKLRFPGRTVLFATILGTLSIPVLVTVIPNFLVMARFGLIGSLWSVILPQLTPPLAIFWMRQYIGRAISNELLEAARLDGLGELGIIHRIVLPLCLPGMAGLAVWLFMTSWNALLLPLAYMQDSNKATFTVFLASLMSFNAVPQTDLLVAACFTSLLPPLVLFAFAQRRFVSGLVEGSVKG